MNVNIHIDLSEVKSERKTEIFDLISNQLINQAGVYKVRPATKREFGQEVFIGEKMNVYVGWSELKVWILNKPEIDG